VSEMIERCAKGIWKKSLGSYQVSNRDLDWETLDEYAKDCFRGYARAVLEIMREPIIDALKPFADCAEELDAALK
jgi:hypothetical protein